MARRRLPPKGTPARDAHEHMLSARRAVLRAYGLIRRIDFDYVPGGREKLAEEIVDCQRVLDEIQAELSRGPESDDPHEQAEPRGGE